MDGISKGGCTSIPGLREGAEGGEGSGVEGAVDTADDGVGI